MNKQSWIDLCNDDSDEESTEGQFKQEESLDFKNNESNSKENISQEEKTSEPSSTKNKPMENQSREQLLELIDAVQEDKPVFLNLWNVDNTITIADVFKYFGSIEILDINNKKILKGILDLKMKNKAEATKLVMLENQKLGKRNYYIRYSTNNSFFQKQQESKVKTFNIQRSSDVKPQEKYQPKYQKYEKSNENYKNHNQYQYNQNNYLGNAKYQKNKQQYDYSYAPKQRLEYKERGSQIEEPKRRLENKERMYQSKDLNNQVEVVYKQKDSPVLYQPKVIKKEVTQKIETKEKQVYNNEKASNKFSANLFSLLEGENDESEDEE